MQKIKMQSLPKGRRQQKESLYWIFRFQEELEAKVHTQSFLERSFRPCITGGVSPDHFPFAFWKSPFVFDKESWLRAEEIMPALYSLFLENLPEFLTNREGVLSALLNYAIWRGRFSWIYSLASLCCQRNIFHLRIFELTILSLAYHREYTAAEFYYKAMTKPSPYLELAYKKLLGTPLDIEKEAMPKEVSLSYSLLRSNWDEHPYRKKQNIWKLCKFPKPEKGEEDNLLHQYASLLSMGLLFRANRLILRYLKDKRRDMSTRAYLLNIVLESYLQNQKYYSYLLRVISSPFQLEEKHWYEIEYCISRLNLEPAKTEIWKNIAKHKEKKPKAPEIAAQNYFQNFMKAAKENQDHLPLGTAPVYSSIIINYYLSAMISEKNILARRYKFYKKLVQDPLEQKQEVDPVRAAAYASSLFWTLYLYMDFLSETPFLQLLESQAGQNLSLRALLAIYHFRKGNRELSEKLIFPTSHDHPMLKTIQVELLQKKGRLRRAKKIAEKLARSYPKDPVLRSNCDILEEQMEEQES